MSHKIHSQARTTPKIRAEIQASNESDYALAKKYNLTRRTVRKWRKRQTVEDYSHCPHKLSTTLSPLEEAIVVEMRCWMLLPLDDLLVITREFVNAKVSRAGLTRCLKRNNVGNLKQLIAQQQAQRGESPASQTEENVQGLRTRIYPYRHQISAQNAR